MAEKAPLRVLGKRAPNGVYEIPILGDIGFFGTAGEDLIRELAAFKPSQVKFIIYSPGGMVYDAIAVAGYVREQGIECFAEIYGVCASAATVFAAIAGPKNTAIAPGSMFLVHMPYGGDDKAIDNAAEYLADLYVKSYGWSRSEARKHMEANEGAGILWTAKEAKSLGVVGEIMEGAKVAAHFNINSMEQKNTIKVAAKVKLDAIDAVKAALTEGVEAEVEVNIEQAVADQIAEKDSTIAELKSQAEALNAKVEELEAAAKPAEGQPTAEELEAVNAKVSELTGEVTAKVEAVAAKEKEIEGLRATIAELEKKVPAATRTVANNMEAAVASAPSADKEHPAVMALRNELRGAIPLKAKTA